MAPRRVQCALAHAWGFRLPVRPCPLVVAVACARPRPFTRPTPLSQSLAAARSAKDSLLRTQQKQRADAAHEMAGGDALKRSLVEHEMMSEKLAEEAVVSRRKLELYEEAFRKIKEATGVR
jgi:hypothetical protein